MKGKTLPFLEGIKSILFLKIKNIPWDVSLRDLFHQSRKFGLVKDFCITDRPSSEQSERQMRHPRLALQYEPIEFGQRVGDGQIHFDCTQRLRIVFRLFRNISAADGHPEIPNNITFPLITSSIGPGITFCV